MRVPPPALSLTMMEAVLGGLGQPQLSAEQAWDWQACQYDIHSDLYPPFLPSLWRIELSVPHHR